jgi:hypothetical protein
LPKIGSAHIQGYGLAVLEPNPHAEREILAKALRYNTTVSAVRVRALINDYTKEVERNPRERGSLHYIRYLNWVASRNKPLPDP